MYRITFLKYVPQQLNQNFGKVFFIGYTSKEENLAKKKISICLCVKTRMESLLLGPNKNSNK
jgi:hypothetical protein